MINILVVDDHALIRKGLKMLLEEGPDFHIAGEAETGQQAINMAREQHFDLILLDISLSDKHGIDVLKQLRNMGVRVSIDETVMWPHCRFLERGVKKCMFVSRGNPYA